MDFRPSSLTTWARSIGTFIVVGLGPAGFGYINALSSVC
ncbi:hypothetical protein FEAC_14120 [Ferrimicrobium acidiphilum DSM 19497]|uniref:Uncharacterized protein n=1 Tax=Ferrimicrobium acidiphilum DSM 19497 TaxID=1121877 RepID=A0A0D8FUJ3_9ACTN|nr:hypothetical protein FEAC_14120 [Ferrimicrobium acidiphilum DSM 19497]